MNFSFQRRPEWGSSFKWIHLLIVLSSLLSAEAHTTAKEHLNNDAAVRSAEDPNRIASLHPGVGENPTEEKCHYQTDGVRICRSHNQTSTNQTGNSTQSVREEKVRIIIISALSVSIVFLVFHLIFFVVISEMRSVSGCCLASLCVSLVVAYIFFLSLTAVDVVARATCIVLAIGIYYFFFVSFFWMNVLAFDVWRSLRSAVKPFTDTDDSFPKRRFVIYSCYAWLTPLALSVITLIVESSDDIPEKFRPGFTPPTCCLKEPLALLIFFTCPFSFLMGLNIIFFAASACIIRSAFVKSAKMVNVKSEIIKLIMHLRLMLLMGITWAFYISYRALRHNELFCAFVFANAFQALFILISFSCVREVKSVVTGSLVRFTRRNKVAPAPLE